MLQLYIIHRWTGPITLVLFTSALLVFAYTAAPKVNAYLFMLHLLAILEE